MVRVPRTSDPLCLCSRQSLGQGCSFPLSWQPRSQRSPAHLLSTPPRGHGGSRIHTCQLRFVETLTLASCQNPWEIPLASHEIWTPHRLHINTCPETCGCHGALGYRATGLLKGASAFCDPCSGILTSRSPSLCGVSGPRGWQLFTVFWHPLWEPWIQAAMSLPSGVVLPCEEAGTKVHRSLKAQWMWGS